MVGVQKQFHFIQKSKFSVKEVDIITFKVGDAVWSNVMGDDVVCMISATASYPVCVKFNECTDIQRYTSEGKWREYDKEPEIFLKGV